MKLFFASIAIVAGLFPSPNAVKELGAAEVLALEAGLKKGNQQMVLMEYSSRCPHCQKRAPLFSKLAERFSSHSEIIFAGVDCESNFDFCKTGKFQIKGFPTVVIVNSAGITPVDIGNIFSVEAEDAVSNLTALLGISFGSFSEIKSAIRGLSIQPIIF